MGPLTLNFQNSFFGQLSVAEAGGPINGVPISPAQIGFTPIVHENQVGFKLTTNFVDRPGSDRSSFSVRTVQFSSTPQANPVAGAVFVLGKHSIQDDWTVGIALSTFLILLKWKVSEPLIIGVAGLLGMAIHLG